MCARYYVPQTEASPEMERLLIEAENRGRLRDHQFSLRRGEIRPGDYAAVLARGRRSQAVSAFPMQWGFHSDHGLIFNARFETVQTKPMFHENFQFRRCLIPMSAYFEWDHRQKPMLKYRFEPAHMQDACLAGIYRYEGQNPVFTVLTCPAAPSIAQFHDRMPVILSMNTIENYLLGTPVQAETSLMERVEALSYGAVC